MRASGAGGAVALLAFTRPDFSYYDHFQVPTNRGPIPILTERYIAAAHTAGLPVHVWTINDETTINELLDLGADGIISDRVRLLRDVLTSRGVALTGASTQRGASTPR